MERFVKTIETTAIDKTKYYGLEKWNTWNSGKKITYYALSLNVKFGDDLENERSMIIRKSKKISELTKELEKRMQR